MKTGCIYLIINTQNDKSYVGSAYDVTKRLNLHREHLRKDKHHSVLLQRAWDKYGSEAFEFKVVEEDVDANFLLAREQFWIWHLDSCNPKKGYNIQKRPGSQAGMKRDDETKAKMAEAQTGRKHTPETFEKMYEVQRNRSEEWRANISKAKKGKQPKQFVATASEGGKKAGSIHQQKMKDDPEYRKKMLANLHSPEARAKANASTTGKKRTAEQKEKMSKAKKGKKPHPNTLEGSAKAGNMHAIRMRDDPEYRANWLEKQAEAFKRRAAEKKKQTEFDF